MTAVIERTNLVMTRRRGETIVIGDGIEVTVVEVLSLNKVRLAVRAPQSVPVDREEVRRRKESAC